ncbi:MAG: 16S rRNA (guanine(527)-N(7))-methyltransferase RsmG [Actinomycetota bacterium]
MKREPSGLSSTQSALLGRYTLLLEERAVPLGLISASDGGRIWTRHVLDCLRAAPLVRDYDRLAYDLGSGSGLPGLVLAIACPWCRFVLVEARARRAGFLELAVQQLGLSNVEVAPRRAEEPSEPADLATSRAFAPLSRAWEIAHPLLRPGGRLIFFAGAAATDPEVAARSLSPAPASVEMARDVATSSPMVIMARG